LDSVCLIEDGSSWKASLDMVISIEVL